MNLISDIRLVELKRCFDAGLSTRKAAIEAGVNRNTAACYFHKFRKSQAFGIRFGNLLAEKEMMVRLSVATWRKLEKEAMARTLSTRELMSEVLDKVAADDLFAAVLD